MEKRVVKSGIWYIIGDLIVKGTAFIVTPIFARVLTDTEYGNVANFASLYAILTMITTLNLHTTLNRARFDFEGEMDRYISSMLALTNIVTVILFAMAWICRDWVMSVLGLDGRSIIIMFVCAYFVPPLDYYVICQMFEYRYKLRIAISVFVGVGGLLLSLVLINNMRDKELARIIGMQLPALIIGAVLYVLYIIRCRVVRQDYCIYALKICLPYIPHLIAMNLLTNMDRVMIKKMCGPEEVTPYAIACSSTAVVSILLVALNTSLSPWFAERMNSKRYDEICKTSRYYVLLLVIPAIAFMFVIPEMMLLMGGRAYIDAKYVLTPLVMACICQFMYTMYVNIEQFEKKTVGMAVGSVLSAVFNWILNYIFIPKYGYYAAAYTTLASYMFLLFVHIYLVRRMGFLKVYDNKYNIIVLFVALICSFLILPLYRINAVVRYIVLFLVSVVTLLILIRKKIITKDLIDNLLN